MSKLPQKSFDSQLHIIRDVHFDVDKYKVGELYVINHMVHPNYLHFGDDPCKTVGYLKAVDEHSLSFRTMKRHEINRDDDIYYRYIIDDFTLTIDEIIEKQMEIERLLTETEAAMYLSTVVLDEGKQFNRLLGLTPDRSQFPYTLERTRSYQALQAAYKIDEETAKECVDYGQIARDLVEEDPVAEMVKHRDSRYLMSHLKSTAQALPYVLTFINDKGEFDPTPFEDMVGTIKITMRKGTSEIVWYTAKKNIRIVPNTIEIKNRNGTVQMILTKETFFLMFDKITFEDQQ